jgi:hypothetical protein
MPQSLPLASVLLQKPPKHYQFCPIPVHLPHCSQSSALPQIFPSHAEASADLENMHSLQRPTLLIAESYFLLHPYSNSMVLPFWTSDPKQLLLWPSLTFRLFFTSLCLPKMIFSFLSLSDQLLLFHYVKRRCRFSSETFSDTLYQCLMPFLQA